MMLSLADCVDISNRIETESICLAAGVLFVLKNRKGECCNTKGALNRGDLYPVSREWFP